MIRGATLLLPLTLFVIASLSPATAIADMTIGEHTIKSGEQLNFSLTVPAGKSDPATFIPLTVFAGVQEGPTAVVVAGVHGFEFAPILAADKLVNTLSMAELKGNVIIVRTAHISAFEHRSPYVNPYDRKNLNRSFPGSADGTQTERIAHALSTYVIPHADFVFDVHSGDGAEWLEAFVGVYGGPLSTDYDAALGVAHAFGFPNIVRYSMNTQEQVDNRRSLNRQAVAQGVATVLVEVGENGRRDLKDIDSIVSGLKNALAYLNILPARTALARRLVETTPRYFDGTQSVPVKHSGVWYPTRRTGGSVAKGSVLGVIKGYDGTELETITAPIDGYTIYGLAGPPVKAGESVVTIAKPVPMLD